jgi:hypothetical protein
MIELFVVFICSCVCGACVGSVIMAALQISKGEGELS